MVIVEGDGGAFGGDEGCGDGRYLNQSPYSYASGHPLVGGRLTPAGHILKN